MKRAWLFVLLAGCGPLWGAGVAQRLTHVHDTTVLARQRGAYACDPLLLAQAETHAELAQLELSAGELVRAEREAEMAADRARQVLAATDRCFPAPAPPR